MKLSLSRIVGNTPLIKLSDKLYGKLETTNPSGSVKDRMVLYVVEHAIRSGEITQNSSARVIRDGSIIYTGKIMSIFREKNQAKQVSAGQECGITLKDYGDFQKKDIIEVFSSTITERMI